MGKFNSNKVIRGTSGRAWVDGDLMANVKSFKPKPPLIMKIWTSTVILGKRSGIWGIPSPGP